MSGDPVEESGQQLRQGAIQAFQMAHTTSALLRGRGGESRSRAEHDQRVRHADDREQRSWIAHQVRVEATIAETNSKIEVNGARVDEIRGRIGNNQDAQQLSRQETEARMRRADQDLSRRNRLGRQEYRHNQQVHDAKLGAYTGRETRANKLHELDVEYKKLLITARKRAAGFADTLSAEGPTGEAAASVAAYAAADAHRDLSAEHASDADAYDHRVAADTGRPHTEMIGPAIDRGEVIDIETVDLDLTSDLNPEFETGSDRSTGSEPEEAIDPEYSPVSAVAGLAEELSAETYFAHTLDSAVAPELSPAEAIAEAAEAAFGTGDEVGSVSPAMGAADLVGTDVFGADVAEPGWEPEP